MESFSTTQATNIAIIAGAIFLVIKMIKPDVGITQEEVTILLTALFVTIMAAISFINRFRKGDLTLGGFRK